ncbi:pyruvate, water dikinase regulatory protein [Chloroflexus sp.]|uniref:pyruvate, water dikinase regulatory protein n=1 Tax=Chloroflexus sp. TaxID=1904827 RepID=UPI002ADE474A|nr:pyruvate, water dikinase regulatory protein [Chloroflexus sp.]
MSDQPVSQTAPSLYIVSGGAGAVGEQVARLTLSQFEGAEVPLIIIPNVRDLNQIAEVVERAAQQNGTILHTLMEPSLRRELMRLARERGVAEIDLVGSVLSRLATVLRKEPLGKPGLYQPRRSAYFERLDAIEYTVAHDDGNKPHELHQADIVLVGISRVGKTPLSMYLAVLGWKVANVPLVREVPLPTELFQVDPRRVIGLIVEAEQITARRRWRQRRMGVSIGGNYTNLDAAYDEVEWARRTFRQHGWTTINVTDKSIEESADEIITLISRRFSQLP